MRRRLALLVFAGLAVAAPTARANTYEAAVPAAASYAAPPDLWMSALKWRSADGTGDSVLAARASGAWTPVFAADAPYGATDFSRTLPDGTSSVRMTGSRVDVLDLRPRFVDEYAPSATDVAGSLTTPGYKSGTVSVTAMLADRGSGLRYAKLGVDGHFDSRNVHLVDANGGTCTEAGAPYATAVPCVLAARDTAALDTTTLADGAHTIEYLIQDAAGNLRTAGEWTITVNNPGGTLADTACSNGMDDDGDGRSDVGEDAGCASAGDDTETAAPSAQRDPFVLGVPVPGATLTAVPAVWDDGPGQGGVSAWRWQACDDDGCEDLPAAGAPTLTIGAGLAGRRVRVLETRSTSEGLASAASALTEPVPVPAPPAPEPPAPQLPPAPSEPPAQPAPARTILPRLVLDDGCGEILTGRRTEVAGRLTDQDGGPLAGVRLIVEERAFTPNAGPSERTEFVPAKLAAPVVTDAHGRFAFTPTAKHSHTIRVRYGTASCELTVVARATASLTADAGRGAVAIAGRVQGDVIPSAGVAVVLEVRGHAGWKRVRALRTDRRGAFHATYRGSLRRFRVRIEATRGFPFAPATTEAVRAR